VALGGGTGLPVVLSGLAGVLRQSVGSANASRWADHLTGIVTVTDDGGSSGRLRSELGMLPPGDIRNCLAALAPNGTLARVLAHRFATKQQLDGHAIGNLLIAALTQMTGDFAQAIDELGTLLDTCGRVFPCTIADVTLRAELSSGDIVDGETAIVDHPARIQRVQLTPQAPAWPDALRALINADVVVVGPGSLYTSVLPNLLVDGVASTLSALQATRILVANLMTQPGETDGMTLDDHLRAVRAHTGRDLFDVILVNRTPPPEARLGRYRSERSETIQVEGLLSAAGSAKVIEADLLDTTGPKVRHDPAKLAQAILAVAGWLPAAKRASAEVGSGADQFPARKQKSAIGPTFSGTLNVSLEKTGKIAQSA
jgi:uncharacterized cofD-like protein